jgi:hypothetical protein
MKSILFLLVAMPLWAHEEERKLALPAEGIDGIEIQSGAGFLVVEGGSNEITVQATIRLRGYDNDEAKEFLDRYMELTLEKRGSSAILRSFFNDREWGWKWKEKGIDLTVRVPKRFHVDIEDGSGSLELKGVDGHVRIDDGSGSIDITDVGGNLRIDDGSGTIQVKNVRGDVNVSDGSGSMTLVDIGGTVKVSDGSGSIDIDRVEHDVIIRSSGSGGLTINNVKGRVERDDDDRKRRWREHDEHDERDWD